MAATKTTKVAVKPAAKPKKLIKKKTKLVGWNPVTWLTWLVESTVNVSRRVQHHQHHARNAVDSIRSLYSDWSHDKGESMAQRRDQRRRERGKVRCVNCQGDGKDVWLSPDEQADHFTNVHGMNSAPTAPVTTQTPSAMQRRKNKTKSTASANDTANVATGGAAMAAAMTAAVTGKTSGPMTKSTAPVTSTSTPIARSSSTVTPIKLGDSGTKTSTDAVGVKPGERSPNGVWVAPTGAISRLVKPAAPTTDNKPGTVTPIRPGIPQPVKGSSIQAVEAEIAQQNVNDKEKKRAARRYRGRHRSDGTTPTVADARGTGSDQSKNWRAAMANLDIAGQAMTWAQNPPESWEEEMADAQQAADEFRGLADALRTRAERLVEAHNIAPDCVVPYEDAANILSQVGDHIMEVSNLIQAKYGELKEAAERGEVPRLEWLAAGSGASQGTGV